MTKHTPGPWGRNIKPASHYPIIYAGRNTHVARVISEGLTEAECEANCDLIAAAPDLLAALKALQRVFVEVSEAYRGKTWVYGAEANLAALDAIKRAEPA